MVFHRISCKLFLLATIILQSINMKDNTAQNSYRNMASMIVAALLVAIAGYSLNTYLNQDNSLTPVVAFQFDTYCPVDSAHALSLVNAQITAQGLPPLDFDYNLNSQIYVVHVQARPSNDSEPNSPALLYYCGLAKRWWEASCGSARYVCSVPGPMFYFEVKQEATIIWVNAINSTNVNWTRTSCYDPESDDHDCTTTAKNADWGSCSYFSPTSYKYDGRQGFRVEETAVPISPHIHGLQIRPAFDGNPLSWFAPDGSRGSAFQSLQNSSYFSLFKHQNTFRGQRPWSKELTHRTKVITVNNDQAPGLLFYHDHAMKSTLYNVQNGLGGLWVISDSQVQKDLPSGKYEKFIVFSKQGDARTTVSPDAYTAPGTQPEFQRDATYRFRILNAAFDNSFNSVVFAAYYTTTIVDGKPIYEEIDPSNSSYKLDDNMHTIPFSVIGTDTTLFHQAIHEISYLNFGPAQRVDLLIRFDVALPNNVNNVYFVCDDLNQNATVIKYQFSVKPTPQTIFEKIAQVLPGKQDFFRLPGQEVPQRNKYPEDYRTLDVPFTDLSLIPQEKIAVRRQRPLFSLPYDMRFMIGAHYMFQNGATDSAKIGTFDDFYLINNLWEDHPMHIHLVNHQAVKSYSLKRLPENPNCTLYFLDYFRNANLPQFAGLSDLQLCDALWGLKDDQVLSLFDSLDSYMREDQVIVTERGVVSGLDVLMRSDGQKRYQVGNCSMDRTHRYVCDDTTQDILPHEKRWKDTSMVHKYSVFILRVRWTSTTYDPEVRPYPYFAIPEEHLVEFPGFVYHCHILPHEDNEMMRSFALQYSDQYRASVPSLSPCARDNWWEQLQCINDKLGCPLAS